MVTRLPVAQPLRILLVEDNPGDVQLILRALRDSPFYSRVTVLRDGEAALSYLGLTGSEIKSEAEAIDLVLLDLNLPRIDGWQVLEMLKGHTVLRTIPVVVLTSSTRGDDIQRCYHLHANAYVAKPTTYGELQRVLREVESFWGQVVQRHNGAMGSLI